MIKNIIIGILILGFIASIIFLDVPWAQKMLNLRKKLANERKSLQEQQDFIAKIEKLTQSYKDNTEVLKNIDYIMTNDVDAPGLIVQLEALAGGSGMLLSNINFALSEESIGSEKAKEVRSGEIKTEQASKQYNIVNINAKMTGDYLAFNRFLQLVEENLRLLDIESITFAPHQTSGASNFEFDVNLRAYYQ